MQKYFIFFILYFFTFYTIYPMNQSFDVKEYACEKFQQAYFLIHDETKVILNTKEHCSIVSLGDKKDEKILFKHDQGVCYYLMIHPKKPLIALSDNNGAIVKYNYEDNTKDCFSLKKPFSVVSVGKFSPQNSIFYCDTGDGIFYLDYESKIIDKLDVFKDCRSTGMNRPLDYCVACDETGNNICIATHDALMIVCNEDNILANKFVEKSKKYELALKKFSFANGYNNAMAPFFCEYALQGLLLICALQNYDYCSEIVLFNGHNGYQREKTINAEEKTHFVNMALHPNGMILATLSLPQMILQFWNIKTGTHFSETICLYPEDKEFRHFYEFFLSYSSSGKKIIVGKVNDDLYKIIEIPDTILTQLYQDIMPSYPVGLLALKTVGLPKELRCFIIEKNLALYRLLK